MLNVLLLEDEDEKASEITEVVKKTPKTGRIVLKRVADVMAAKKVLLEQQFDVMFLDILVPQRKGEDPTRDGGVRLLQEITKSRRLKRPRFIVGITAFPDIAAEAEATFASHLFGLVHYNRASTAWADAIQNLIGHASVTRSSQGDPRADLAIICALDDPELQQVLAQPVRWQKLPLESDATVYYRGTIGKRDAERNIVAAAAPQMGMPACAAVAMKMICRFAPRYIAMTGIAAGRRGEGNIGDLVLGDPSWDCGNGKIVQKEDGELQFLPEPVQARLDPLLKSQIKLCMSEPGFADGLRNKWQGNKPSTVVSLQAGPIASGAAVIAAEAITDALREQQNRKLTAIDMETYGVFIAAMYAPYPRPTAFSLKGISDFADSKKDDQYRAYAAHVSASTLMQWVARYL